MGLLEGRVALITGASSGIGKATAYVFVREGASVALAARSEEKLCEIADSLGPVAAAVPCDVTKDSDRQQAVRTTIERFGKLDILVNAAGIIKTGTIETTTIEDWDEMFDINVRSVQRLIQLALPHLIENKGAIVNVSSVCGLRSFPGILAYAASKAALDQLTRCASLELAPKGVRINAVNPGVVRTELHRRGGMSEEEYAKFLEHSAKVSHPLGRVGEPDEIAELIAFLASEKASWITGVTYNIDGGRANTCAR